MSSLLDNVLVRCTVIFAIVALAFNEIVSRYKYGSWETLGIIAIALSIAIITAYVSYRIGKTQDNRSGGNYNSNQPHNR